MVKSRLNVNIVRLSVTIYIFLRSFGKVVVTKKIELKITFLHAQDDLTMGNISTCHRNRTESKIQGEQPCSFELQKSMMNDLAIPKLSQLHVLRDEKAQLIESSTFIFGQMCLRLVNITLHTSQMFPSLMGTNVLISQYLRQQLRKEYPYKDFYIIIADNDTVGFALGDGEQYAVIQQEQYKIMIFSMKKTTKNKSTTKVLNGRRKLHWESITIKQT